MSLKFISLLFLKQKLNRFLFLFLLIVGIVCTGTSCKKQTYKNGNDLLASQYGINSVLVDTFTLNTYSVMEDRVRCTNNTYTMLGIYNDPVFGKVNSSIYTNLLLENPGTTNFTNSQTIDSIVLSLQYNGYYGSPEHIFTEVYELSELMNVGDTMYQNSTVAHLSENLVDPNFTSITPKPTEKSIVGTDTLSAQMRIRLKSSFAQHLIDGVAQGKYETQDAFKDFIKGLYIKVTNYNPSSGKGAVYYFNMKAVNSGLTIYYKDEDAVAKSFRYLINDKGVYFNHVDVARANTKVEKLLNDQTLGQKEFYAQAYGIRAVVEIPGIKKIPANAIIHSATLDLPFTSYYLDKFYPSASVTIGYYEDNDLSKPKTIKNGYLYNQTTKSFSIDLNNYASKLLVAQDIVRGLINTQTFFIIPDNYVNSAERIIFNGKNTDYKSKPKLTVIYTQNK